MLAELENPLQGSRIARPVSQCNVGTQDLMVSKASKLFLTGSCQPLLGLGKLYPFKHLQTALQLLLLNVVLVAVGRYV